MKLKSTENNIYQIELTAEELEQRTGMEGVPFEECEEILKAPNTYIRYVCDYVNGFMMCKPSRDVTAQEHMICIASIIKDIYEVYKKKAPNDDVAEWFRNVLTNMVNSNEFWRENYGNKYIFDE